MSNGVECDGERRNLDVQKIGRNCQREGVIAFEYRDTYPLEESQASRTMADVETIEGKGRRIWRVSKTPPLSEEVTRRRM